LRAKQSNWKFCYNSSSLSRTLIKFGENPAELATLTSTYWQSDNQASLCRVLWSPWSSWTFGWVGFARPGWWSFWWLWTRDWTFVARGPGRVVKVL